MLVEGVLLVQTLSLKPSPDYLQRVSYSCGQHAGRNASQNLPHTFIFELLVEHVMKATKCGFFETAR
jgi:hypothetical protein